MKDNIPHHRVDQYGFTLIELMISLVLGLLISAAVMQVFLTSQRVDRIQTAASEIQDKAVFGLQAIESQVRLANLGNDGVAINDTTAMGGIVLTAADYTGGNEGGGEIGGDGEDSDSEDSDSEDSDSEDGDSEDGDSEDGDSEDGDSEDGDSEDGDSEDGDDKDDKDDKKKKEKLEKEAAKKEKEAAKLEKKADEKEAEAAKKEKEADEKEKKGDKKGAAEKRAEAAEKRREAEAKRAEAAKKRAEAEAKRAEAAKIGNKTAYNFRDIQPPTFQRANFQIASFRKIGFQRTGFQKVALSSASGLANVMIKGGLSTEYLTRSGSMTSSGNSTKWNGLSNTNQSSDQLTIQYINSTGRTIYDCEGAEVLAGERVISRYFVANGTGTEQKDRKNLNLRCDAGRITSDGKLEKFMDSGETIIENIDQFNIRLGVQSSLANSDPSNYQYADMTVAEYMALSGEKPAITNIRIAILARSTANSPEASADSFKIFGVEQTLKKQDDAPKYLRRVYETNILLRNARIMRIINTTVT